MSGAVEWSHCKGVEGALHYGGEVRGEHGLGGEEGGAGEEEDEEGDGGDQQRLERGKKYISNLR